MQESFWACLTGRVMESDHQTALYALLVLGLLCPLVALMLPFFRGEKNTRRKKNEEQQGEELPKKEEGGSDKEYCAHISNEEYERQILATTAHVAKLVASEEYIRHVKRKHVGRVISFGILSAIVMLIGVGYYQSLQADDDVDLQGWVEEWVKLTLLGVLLWRLIGWLNHRTSQPFAYVSVFPLLSWATVRDWLWNFQLPTVVESLFVGEIAYVILVLMKGSPINLFLKECGIDSLTNTLHQYADLFSEEDIVEFGEVLKGFAAKSPGDFKWLQDRFREFLQLPLPLPLSIWGLILALAGATFLPALLKIGYLLSSLSTINTCNQWTLSFMAAMNTFDDDGYNKHAVFATVMLIVPLFIVSWLTNHLVLSRVREAGWLIGRFLGLGLVYMVSLQGLLNCLDVSDDTSARFSLILWVAPIVIYLLLPPLQVPILRLITAWEGISLLLMSCHGVSALSFITPRARPLLVSMAFLFQYYLTEPMLKKAIAICSSLLQAIVY